MARASRQSLPSTALLRATSQVYPVGLMGARAPGIFAARREGHLEHLEFPAVFAGVDREPGGENLWMMSGLKIFQEPALMHLTGINQTGVRLLLDPRATTPARRAILFLPLRNPEREFWDGLRLGLLPENHPEAGANLDLLRRLLGFETILPAIELPRTIAALAAGREKRVGVFLHDYRHPKTGRRLRVPTDHNAAFARQVASWIRPQGGKVVAIADLHYRLRLPLDATQVRECERAQLWTERAFRTLLPQIPRLGREHEIAATLEGLMLFQSPFGLAFPTICASGANACTLHYLKNDEPVDRDGLVLLDFGCRSSTMHSDISRTVPASGRFDPLQALLYEIVREAKERNASAVRPGTTIRELNRATWDFIENALEERFVARGGRMHRAYGPGGLATLAAGQKAHPGQPHGVSHLMGEAEHDGDPFRIYQDLPLEPGWMLSNEPGIYGDFQIRLEGRTWKRRIGIRLEDDLLVAARGCRNLSSSIPDGIAEIESLMAEGTPLPSSDSRTDSKPSPARKAGRDHAAPSAAARRGRTEDGRAPARRPGASAAGKERST